MSNRACIRDIATVPIAASVFQNVAQLMPNGAFTPLTYDSDDYDFGNLHDLSIPTRLTIPPGERGIYTITGVYATFAHAPSLPYAIAISIRRNGVTFERTLWGEVNVAIEHEIMASVDLLLEAGEYVECLGFNGAAVPVNTIAGGSRSRFSIHRAFKL